jgi:hypothetical protein
VVKLPEFLYKTVRRECRYLKEFGFYEMLKLSISFVITLYLMHLKKFDNVNSCVYHIKLYFEMCFAIHLHPIIM